MNLHQNTNESLASLETKRVLTNKSHANDKVSNSKKSFKSLTNALIVKFGVKIYPRKYAHGILLWFETACFIRNLQCCFTGTQSSIVTEPKNQS